MFKNSLNLRNSRQTAILNQKTQIINYIKHQRQIAMRKKIQDALNKKREQDALNKQREQDDLNKQREQDALNKQREQDALNKQREHRNLNNLGKQKNNAIGHGKQLKNKILSVGKLIGKGEIITIQ